MRHPDQWMVAIPHTLPQPAEHQPDNTVSIPANCTAGDAKGRQPFPSTCRRRQVNITHGQLHQHRFFLLDDLFTNGKLDFLDSPIQLSNVTASMGMSLMYRPKPRAPLHVDPDCSSVCQCVMPKAPLHENVSVLINLSVCSNLVDMGWPFAGQQACIYLHP